MPKFTVVIEREDDFYIAKCLELGITSQGKTHGTALDNIKEAIDIYFKENPKAEKREITIVSIEV